MRIKIDPADKKTSPQLAYYYRNREAILAKKIEEYKDPETKARKWVIVKNSRLKNPEVTRRNKSKGGVVYRRKYTEKLKIKHAAEYKELRVRVLESLGGIKCVKCGYDDYRAMQIDHINGGGMKHIRSFSSNKTYLRTVEGNRKEFQVLCANCNRIKVYENQEYAKPRINI